VNLERKEFMLVVDVLNGADIKQDYKAGIFAMVKKACKKGLDRGWGVDQKVLLEKLETGNEEEYIGLWSKIVGFWERYDREGGIKELNTAAVSVKNYYELKTVLKRFLILEIEHYALQNGGREQLSLKLEKTLPFVQMTLQRGSFGSLERLWKDIKEKLGE